MHARTHIEDACTHAHIHARAHLSRVGAHEHEEAPRVALDLRRERVQRSSVLRVRFSGGHSASSTTLHIGRIAESFGSEKTDLHALSILT
eukprot:1534917-Pleurochrysis_carterae.AAC.1